MRRTMLLFAAMLCASLAAAAPALAAPYAMTSTYHPTLTSTEASLVGQVGDSSGAADVIGYFEYGKTNSLGSQTAEQTANPSSGIISETLRNLDPGTTYYYRAVAKYNGETATGSIETFETPAHVPPTATTNAANPVGVNSAQLNGTVSNDAGYYFEWGTSTGALTNKTADKGFGGNVNESLSGLTENTTYYFRVVATKAGGPDVPGETKSFKTDPSEPNRDDDNDGFKNGEDRQCQNTPGQAAGPYNARGCPIPPDPDNDGFPNGYDACPEPGNAQTAYNAQGCPTPPDSDGDSYPDAFERCPTVPGGAPGPDNDMGCPRVDSDGDGYFDSEDQCAQGPPEFAVGGPAVPENGNKQGCPINDKDKDAIADIHDKCPDAGNVYEMGEGGQFTNKVIKQIRPAGHKYAGCIKMGVAWYALRVIKSFPSMKDFLKDQKFTWSMICGGACKVTQTLSFDAATTKKLKLKSPVIDSISDSASCSANSQCTSGYLFNPGPNYQIPASIKKKLAKLKTVTVLLTVNLTDTTLKEKSKWGTKIEVGTKKKPKELAEL